jgi:hypothetical protein
MKSIPVDHIQTDPHAGELPRFEDSRPYDEYVMALMSREDTGKALAAIAALPIVDRYTSRIVSGLNFGLADFDSVCVRADIDTLSASDLADLREQLLARPYQLSKFLLLIYGKERLLEIMSAAIKTACHED